MLAAVVAAAGAAATDATAADPAVLLDSCPVRNQYTDMVMYRFLCCISTVGRHH